MFHVTKTNILTLGLFASLLLTASVQAVDISQFMSYEQAVEMVRRANGGTLTPEQEQKIAKQYGREAPQVAPKQSAETEASLAEKILALSASPATAPSDLKVEDLKDGLRINGQALMDSEGSISQYAFDILTAEITYLVEINPGNFIVKCNHLGGMQDGIAIATAQKNSGGWTVQLSTGKTLRGELLTILPKGVLVSRNTAAFKYVPGVGVQNIQIPQGWIAAAFQRGNVGASNYMLLEKVKEESDSSGTLGSLWGHVKTMGSLLGVGKSEDYALLNLTSSKLVLINISAGGKDVSTYSNCRKQNNFVNQCDSMTSRASLFENDGSRNINHYFWRINWFNTPTDPIAVALEGNLQDVTITDLTSAKRVVLFNRTLGIRDFVATEAADGKVKVTAQLGLESKSNDDVLAYLQATPALVDPASAEKK